MSDTTVSLSRGTAAEIVEALASHPNAYDYMYLIDDLKEAIEDADDEGTGDFEPDVDEDGYDPYSGATDYELVM